MTDVVIRKMQPGDMAAVLKILKQWNMAPIAPSKALPDPERSTIHVANTFVAVAGDKLVGVASYIEWDNELAETASLAVDPAYKGQGVGFRLQTARLKEMKAKGFKRVRSETDRPETIQWYIRNFGYRIAGRNPKKHTFSLAEVDFWTVLELDLAAFHEHE